MLDDLIDGWLKVPAHRLVLRFPDRLEQRFEADTGADRCHSMMVTGGAGFLFATLLFPALRASLPDVVNQSRLLYLCIAMPVGFLVAASMWLRPPPVLREGLCLFANMLCTCVTMYLFATGHAASPALFISAVTVLLVYSSVGIQLRFPFALAAMVIIVSLFALALHIQGGASQTDQTSQVMVMSATAAYLMLASFRLERAARRDYLMVLRERLQRQDLSLRNMELDELARRDPLTGLANRRAYDAWVAAAWTQESAAEKSGSGKLGLIVIDVDRFKAFNDFYGHAAGDICLKQIAVCLREQLRGMSDLVARLGGEEFAVLLPGLSESLCADVAERMRLAVQRLELPHSGMGPHGLVTVSAGVASHPTSAGSSPAGLFEAADSALYEAKLSGRNRVCVGTTPGLIDAGHALTG